MLVSLRLFSVVYEGTSNKMENIPLILVVSKLVYWAGFLKIIILYFFILSIFYCII